MRKDPAGSPAAVSPEDISIRVFDGHVRLWVVFIPAPKMPIAFPFWMNAGVGISTRLAEDCLRHADMLHEVAAAENAPAPQLEEVEAHGIIRERIAGLMERVRIILV